MPSTYWPPDEVEKRYVELFLADATLVGSPLGTNGLLYPDYAPLLADPLDLRVWASGTPMPSDPAIREGLPRVLVEAWGELHGREQRDASYPGVAGQILDGPVSMRVHVLVGPLDKALGGRISARTALLILSTQASNARMIASEFVPDGSRTEEQTSFRDSWDFVSRWRSQNVGALT